MCSKELPRLNRAGNVGARQISAQRGSWRGRGAHTLLSAHLCISVKRSGRQMSIYLIIAVALCSQTSGRANGVGEQSGVSRSVDHRLSLAASVITAKCEDFFCVFGILHMS